MTDNECPECGGVDGACSSLQMCLRRLREERDELQTCYRAAHSNFMAMAAERDEYMAALEKEQTINDVLCDQVREAAALRAERDGLRAALEEIAGHRRDYRGDDNMDPSKIALQALTTKEHTDD